MGGGNNSPLPNPAFSGNLVAKKHVSSELFKGFKNMEPTHDKWLFEQLKTTIALTSGALIVSLSVLNAKSMLIYKGVLYISWAFLINAIIFGILAQTAGINIYRRTSQGSEGKLKGKEKELYDRGRVLTLFEAKTPDVHVWSFTIGLVSLFIFVFLNVHNAMKW